MKVYIFTEGGGEFGLGHIARCCSLYDELTERGIMVEFIIFGDINGLSILKDKNVSNTNWISCDYLNTHLKHSNYCIVDSYLATKEIYQIISAKVKKALFIDDNMRKEYPKGIIVRPSLYKYVGKYNSECVGESVDEGAGKGDSKNEGEDGGSEHKPEKDKDHRYLTGVEFILLRSAFNDEERVIRKRNTGEVLITMGGTDIRNLTPQIVDLLCIKHSEIKFHIVLGKDTIDHLRKKEPDNVLYYCNIDAKLMKELMLKSQFAITAAGQTIYELLVTGTPFIAIKVIDNQKDNVRAIKELIPGIPVIDYYDRNFMEKLEAEFDAMLRNSGEEVFRKRYANIVDGRGSKRIVDALLSLEL